MSVVKIFTAVLFANLITVLIVLAGGSYFQLFSLSVVENSPKPVTELFNPKVYVPVAPIMEAGDRVVFKGLDHQQCKLFRHSGSWSGAEIFLPKCPVEIGKNETITMVMLSKTSCRIERISSSGNKALIQQRTCFGA